MKVQLLVLMAVLVQQRKSLVLLLVKQTQTFLRLCIVMLIIVIYMLIEKKYLSLKPSMKMLTFQLNSVSELYLMDLVLLSLDKYL